MATNLKPVTQLDFSGGSNLVTNPYLVSQKQSQEIDNMVLDEHGSLRTRDGVTTISTNSDTVQPILLRGNLVRNNGQEFPFAIQAQGGGAAVTFDQSTTFSFNSGVSTWTKSATLGGTATMVLVKLYITSASFTISSVTWNGIAMTQIISYTASGRTLVLYGLANPATGTHNAVVTFSGPTSGNIAVASYIGAKSWVNAQSASGTGTTISNTITSATNHLVTDFVSDIAGAALTVGAGQTAETISGGIATSREAGAAAVAMTWTFSPSNAWLSVGVSLAPTSASKLFDTTSQPWTVAGTFTGAEDLPDVVYMADKAIFFNGYETPRSWDGSAFTALVGGSGSAPVGAKHGVFHLGALWLWNTAQTTTASTGPSSLQASATNDPNDWPAANQIFISKDDGQEGMGIVPFTIVETGIAPTATLVAFKNYRGYQITGTFGTSAFSIQPIKSDMGCIAPRSIQFVSGFGVIRLTHKGFALYNGVEDRLISEEVRPAIFGNATIGGIDFTNVKRSWAIQSQNPPLYIAACPTSGTGLTRLFVYDLVRRGWTLFTLPTALSCMNIVFGRGQFPTVNLGTATGGTIQDFFTGQSTDNGVDISWSVTTRNTFAGNPMTPAFWRRAQVAVAGPPNTVITITPIVENGERTAQVFSLADSTEAEIESLLPVDILETAAFMQLRIEGTKRCRIRGVEYQISPKPSTKHTSRR